MTSLKTPNHVGDALDVVRGVENLSSQDVCLCMAVFVCNASVHEKEKESVWILGQQIVCVWSCLASTILVGPLRLLVELWPLFTAGDSRVVVVQTLRHPLADDIHQPLEGLLHVNVVFSACLEVLKTQLFCQLPAPVCGHHSFILHVTLVPHQEDLGIIPRVGLDLGRPVLNRVEGLLVGDVIHEDEAHGSPVVSCGDCPVALLASSVPYLQLYPLVVPVDCLHLEVDAHCADKGWRE